MTVELVLNDYDVSLWLEKDGLAQTEIVRISRSVITLDGTKHLVEKRKRGISAKFIRLRDVVWYAINSAVETRPVKVKYVDDALGERTAYFLVTDLSGGAEEVAGGITYFSGCSISLEER